MKAFSLTQVLTVALIGFAVPAYVAVGSVVALGQKPAVSSQAITPEDEVAPLNAAKPIYHELMDPVVATLESGQTLSLELALVLEPETPSSLLVVFDNGRSVLTADLATAVQDIIQDTSDPFTWSDVAVPVTQSMRTALNTAFERDGMPAYAREVLVLKAIHSSTTLSEK